MSEPTGVAFDGSTDSAQDFGSYVEVCVDVERPRGRWTRVTGVLGEPDPETGQPRPVILACRAVRDDGEIVKLTTQEVHALRDRFERAYYHWRNRGVRQS